MCPEMEDKKNSKFSFNLKIKFSKLDKINFILFFKKILTQKYINGITNETPNIKLTISASLELFIKKTINPR